MLCEIQRGRDLRGANGLRLPAVADWFAEAESLPALREALRFAAGRRLPVAVLGEGSNLVLGETLPGLTVRPALRGRERDGTRLWAAAGENWHQLVLWALEAGLYGLENLALIPGSCGAAPMQNIGAYGAEAADFIVEVQALHKKTLETARFSKADCGFGYRSSRFRVAENPWVITGITLELHSAPQPRTDYPGLAAKLQAMGLRETPADVAKAVMALRRAKLPDPAVEPNVGSFFKNPSLAPKEAESLQACFPAIPLYVAGGKTRTSAAWLIEQAGMKDLRVGDAAISERHALVIVNLGNATNADVQSLATQAQQRVQADYGLLLEQEPASLPA